jgi:hypothetical protein
LLVCSFALVLAAHGFSDLETLIDPDVLDDATLLSDIKMTKMDIRKFRSVLNKDGAILASKVAAKLKGGGKDCCDGKGGGKADGKGSAGFSLAGFGGVDLDDEDTALSSSSSRGALVSALRKAGLSKLLEPLVARGVDSVALLASCSDDWLKAELKQSKMDVRKLRHVVPQAPSSSWAPSLASSASAMALDVDGEVDKGGFFDLDSNLMDGGRAARERAKAEVNTPTQVFETGF